MITPWSSPDTNTKTCRNKNQENTMTIDENNSKCLIIGHRGFLKAPERLVACGTKKKHRLRTSHWCRSCFVPTALWRSHCRTVRRSPETLVQRKLLVYPRRRPLAGLVSTRRISSCNPCRIISDLQSQMWQDQVILMKIWQISALPERFPSFLKRSHVNER